MDGALIGVVIAILVGLIVMIGARGASDGGPGSDGGGFAPWFGGEGDGGGGDGGGGGD